MIRPIEIRDQEPLARLIRSVFEEYGAPLVNTVYSCSINKLNYDHREYFINKKFLLNPIFLLNPQDS